MHLVVVPILRRGEKLEPAILLRPKAIQLDATPIPEDPIPGNPEDPIPGNPEGPVLQDPEQARQSRSTSRSSSPASPTPPPARPRVIRFRWAASEVLPDIKPFQRLDPAISDFIEALENPDDANRDDVPAGYRLTDGVLTTRNLIYVPDNEDIKVRILQQAHDTKETGHPGQAKTLEILRRNFFWPRMRDFINEYINSCDACQRNKPVHHRKFGLLQPLPVPTGPWRSISMDHIQDLPRSQGHNAILVVVDRLTKQAHFIKADARDDAKKLAKQFEENIFRLHGFPVDIVSDRGTTFNSEWW